MMYINKWDYDLLKQRIQLQELKLMKIAMIKEYLKISKPPIYMIKKRKKWFTKYNELSNQEEEILNSLHILYVEFEDLIQLKRISILK